jgi:hypothetical protein
VTPPRGRPDDLGGVVVVAMIFVVVKSKVLPFL